jgi:hypothetical protein
MLEPCLRAGLFPAEPQRRGRGDGERRLSRVLTVKPPTPRIAPLAVPVSRAFCAVLTVTKLPRCMPAAQPRRREGDAFAPRATYPSRIAAQAASFWPCFARLPSLPNLCATPAVEPRASLASTRDSRMPAALDCRAAVLHTLNHRWSGMPDFRSPARSIRAAALPGHRVKLPERRRRGCRERDYRTLPPGMRAPRPRAPLPSATGSPVLTAEVLMR